MVLNNPRSKLKRPSRLSSPFQFCLKSSFHLADSSSSGGKRGGPELVHTPEFNSLVGSAPPPEQFLVLAHNPRMSSRHSAQLCGLSSAAEHVSVTTVLSSLEMLSLHCDGNIHLPRHRVTLKRLLVITFFSPPDARFASPSCNRY